MRYRVLSLLLVVTALACGPSQEELANGDDPIASLAATVRSNRYGEQFWKEQRDSRTEQWQRAIAYCEPGERANYPNCEVVNQVKFLTTPEAPKNPARSEEGLKF
jgi:hypothetical protein